MAPFGGEHVIGSAEGEGEADEVRGRRRPRMVTCGKRATGSPWLEASGEGRCWLALLEGWGEGRAEKGQGRGVAATDEELAAVGRERWGDRAGWCFLRDRQTECWADSGAVLGGEGRRCRVEPGGGGRDWGRQVSGAPRGGSQRWPWMPLWPGGWHRSCGLAGGAIREDIVTTCGGRRRARSAASASASLDAVGQRAPSAGGGTG